ncbi:MAG: cupin domain-containing protein [Ignavibacteriae bacterium]|nr:cupin domain-containing protein [Ignavibacteriota bacterium]MCB9214430.1 cupin domain-containing protein [Ignavibacteria bacterium]
MALLSKQIIATEDVRVCTFTLAPFEEGDIHYHSAVVEHLVPLSGSIVLSVEGKEKRPLRLGELFEISTGEVHQVINVGETSAEYLLIQGTGRYDFNVV